MRPRALAHARLASARNAVTIVEKKDALLPLYKGRCLGLIYIIMLLRRPLFFAPCLHPARGPKRIGSQLAGRTQESLRARMGMLRRRASAWPHAQNALARSRLQPPPEARLFA